MAFTYEYPRPSVTADVVLFTIRKGELAVLLVKRKHEPFAGTWALPGGFVDQNEPLERAALRELREETGVTPPPLEQLGAFGDPGRDPRGHTVTVAFLSFVVADTIPLAAGDDAAECAWHRMRDLPLAYIPGLRGATGAELVKRNARGAKVKLAFDHDRILAVAWARLAARVTEPPPPDGFELLPERFTLNELRRVYEAVAGEEVPARDFRSRFVATGLIEPVVSPGARSKGPVVGAAKRGAKRAAVKRTRAPHLFRWTPPKAPRAKRTAK